MTAALQLLASTAAGALLGAVFFWGLWLTVRRLRQARHPVLWMLLSLALRFGLVIVGFYLLARYGGWEALIAAAIGFTLARLIVVRRARRETLMKEADA